VDKLRKELEKTEALRIEVDRLKRQSAERGGMEDQVERWKKEATRLEVEMHESAVTWQHEVSCCLPPHIPPNPPHVCCLHVNRLRIFGPVVPNVQSSITAWAMKTFAVMAGSWRRRSLHLHLHLHASCASYENSVICDRGMNM
jgi:hypothetical protein